MSGLRKMGMRGKGKGRGEGVGVGPIASRREIRFGLVATYTPCWKEWPPTVPISRSGTSIDEDLARDFRENF